MRYTYADYERAKADWLRRNPDCTPAEYARKCRAIARRMRL
jgi:hypothetical protein